VRQELRVADDDGRARRQHLGLGHRFKHDLRPDPRRVAHRDGDARQPAARAARGAEGGRLG
jgi:hypothetical protein